MRKSKPNNISRIQTPVEGIPLEAQAKMTRQQRYKLRRYAAGLCGFCGRRPRSPESASLCAECLHTQRERMRARTGAGRRNLKSKSYAASSTPTLLGPVDPVVPPAPAKKPAKAPATRRKKAAS